VVVDTAFFNEKLRPHVRKGKNLFTVLLILDFRSCGICGDGLVVHRRHSFWSYMQFRDAKAG
jgi:hypothetical protein